MRKTVLASALAGAMTVTTGVSAADLPADTTAYINGTIANGTYVGMVVGLIDGKDTVIKGFGVASKETSKAPDASTVFEIGSITKTFTATLLAEEVIKGEMKLSDTAQMYLPEGITLAQVGDRPITLEDVATHYSGLPRMPEDFKPANAEDPYADFPVEKLWEAVNTVKPVRAPGAAPEYSNFAFAMLGQIVARKTGMSYRDLIKSRIFKPLGMTHSDTMLTDTMKPASAQGYASDGKPTPHWTLTGFAPAGAINSTLTDMLAYLHANMAASDAASASELNRAMVMAHEPRADMAPNGAVRIGLAWLTTPTGDGYWHNGGTGGFRSFAGFTNDGERGVVILSNSGGQGVDEIGFHLLNTSAALPEIKTEITLAADKLDEYVGTYAVTPQAGFTVKRKGDQLEVQLTGQGFAPVYPDKPDHFFYKVVPADITFERTADGKISGLTLHQNGQNTRADRLGPDGKPVVAFKHLDLTPTELGAYVGQYQLTPQLVFTVTRDGTQLMVQLTGQPALPVYADKPDHFFYRVVDARIDFVRDPGGRVTSLMLHQNGRDMTAPRI